MNTQEPQETQNVQTFNIMIDIETGGLVPGSSIFAIGACYFALSANGPELPLKLAHSFFSAVDRTTCKESGLIEYAETMEWWDRQSEEARLSTLYGRVPLKTALTDLATYITDAREVGYKVQLWCKQNNFDFSILEAAYKACDMGIPWTFRELRDCRTVFEVFAIWYTQEFEKALKEGCITHNALGDAIYQARKMEYILEQLSFLDALGDIYLQQVPSGEEEGEEGESDE